MQGDMGAEFFCVALGGWWTSGERGDGLLHPVALTATFANLCPKVFPVSYQKT